MLGLLLINKTVKIAWNLLIQEHLHLKEHKHSHLSILVKNILILQVFQLETRFLRFLVIYHLRKNKEELNIINYLKKHINMSFVEHVCLDVVCGLKIRARDNQNEYFFINFGFQNQWISVLKVIRMHKFIWFLVCLRISDVIRK